MKSFKISDFIGLLQSGGARIAFKGLLLFLVSAFFVTVILVFSSGESRGFITVFSQMDIFSTFFSSPISEFLGLKGLILNNKMVMEPEKISAIVLFARLLGFATMTTIIGATSYITLDLINDRDTSVYFRGIGSYLPAVGGYCLMVSAVYLVLGTLLFTLTKSYPLLYILRVFLLPLPVISTMAYDTEVIDGDIVTTDSTFSYYLIFVKNCFIQLIALSILMVVLNYIPVVSIVADILWFILMPAYVLTLVMAGGDD